MCFIGQIDTGGYESGEVYFNKINKVFSGYDSLWCNLRDMGIDGCSAMRSTQDYAGATTHGDIGKCFVAHINRDLCPRRLLAFHSVLHIISQAVQDSLKCLLKDWFKHIRLLYTYSARLSKRKHKLKECHSIAIENLDNLTNLYDDLYESHSWQLVYPNIYCDTRWICLHSCCNNVIGVWITLVVLKDQLIADNYGGINE